MIPTIFGLATILVGSYLLVCGSLAAMLAFVTLWSLMGGSAAIIVTSLGGSSIPPASLALGFFILRVFLPGTRSPRALKAALGDNLALLIFCAYGVVAAFFLPRLFAGAIDVTPMRSSGLLFLLQTFPLSFSSQNVTTAFYLVGTGIAAVCAGMAIRSERAAPLFVSTAIAVTWLHACSGIASVVLKNTPFDAVIEFFRSGSYAQVEQQVGGFVRMSGILPEASDFAAYGLIWFIFCTELWVRDIRPRASGIASAFMLCTLLMSTSATAYVGIAGYVVILAARSVLVPGSLPATKAVTVLFIGIGVAAATLLLLLAFPRSSAAIGDVFQRIVLNKSQTSSGVQRSFWAHQGIDAFKVSFGLGIGPGSFRSSSIVTAILGSEGVIGFAAFAWYLIDVLKPWRASTYSEADTASTAIGAAAGWTAFAMLIPAAISSPSADPGLEFALFSGIALALRRTDAPAADPAPRTVATVESSVGAGWPVAVRRNSR